MNVRERGQRDLRLQLLAFFLLVMLPIFILVSFFYWSASEHLRNDIAAADLNLARAIALEMDDRLLMAKEAVAAFAQMPAVIEADPSGMEQAFQAGAAARQDINLFYRLSAEGIMLYHYPVNPHSTVGQDFAFRDYFQTAQRTQQHVFSKGRISPTTNRPVVTSVMPVFKEGQFAGVVATNLELQHLTETIRRLGLELPHNNGLKIFIIDATDQVIAHTEPENVLGQPPDMLSDLSTLLSNQEGSVISTDEEEVEWLYSYSLVPSANWGVIVQRPTQLAFSSLNGFQQGLILALVLFCLGALFFWIMLSRRVFRPLEKITRFGEGVGQETLEAELNRETILPDSQRPDQIGRLTRTLLRTEHHIRSRLMELTTLNKTSTAVASTLDTQQVIRTILNEVQRLLQVRQCALLVVNEDTHQLEVWASRGFSRSNLARTGLGEALQKLSTYQAIVAGQPVQVSNLAADIDFLPLLPVAQAEKFRSMLIIPLTALYVPPAALAICHADVHHFDEREIDLATNFANHAAMALEHATLFNLTDAELQKRVRFLSTLNQVGHSISQSLVMDDILNNALDAIFEAMAVDACWISLQRETEDFLRLRAQRGFPPKAIERLNGQGAAVGGGMMEQIAKNGQPQCLDKAQLETGIWSTEPLIANQTWGSLVGVPLQAKDTIVGVLGMVARTEGAFTEAEVQLLQAIGDQVAIAVVNARLYRRSREAATLEERNRVAREIHDTLAQGFTGILVQLQAAERLSLKRPEQALQSLQDARDLARESLQEARRSVFNLRPTILEDFTLDRAIAQQLQRFERDNGLKADLILQGYPSPLDPDIEQNLYRITQEALTNVGRHSQAGEVIVTLTFAPKTVTLCIADDGIGLNGHNGRTERPAIIQEHSGFGLVSIQERAKLMQGQVRFETPVTGGTRIKVVIPK